MKATPLLLLGALVLGACGDDDESNGDASDTREVSPDIVDDTTEPVDTTEPDAADTTEPVDTTEPDAADTTEPDAADTTEPDAADTTEPDADTTEPDAADTTEPDAADTTEPDAADTTEPDGGDVGDATPDGDGTTTSGCGGALGPVVASAQWSVVAGTPEREGGGVRGCMTFAREGGADTRGGGICLLTDLGGDVPCVTADDCTTALGPPLAEGFHYCTAPAGVSAKTCWTRPGPPTTYCDRNQARMPGTVETKLVPANVLARATRWISYACLADDGVPGGCGTGQNVSATSPVFEVTDLPSTAAFYASTATLGPTLTMGRAVGALSGMASTSPVHAPSPALAARLAAVDPAFVLDFTPEAYDAVIIAALAAETAHANTADGVVEWAVTVPDRGEKCTTFQSCLVLVAARKDIDYDGESGPIEYGHAGEPTFARYQVARYGLGNVLDLDAATAITVGDPADVYPTSPPQPARDTPVEGGALKIGALIAETGPLATYGAAARAAIELAVADVNAAGGVNGEPVEIVFADEGSADDDLVVDGMDTLLADGVDVVIGPLASSQTLRVIDAAIDAGVPVVSPANTSDALSTYPDGGYYFRTAAPDGLEARALAEVAYGEGATQVLVFTTDDAATHAFAISVVNELITLGLGGGAYVIKPYASQADIVAAVASLNGWEPDTVMLFGAADAGFIVDQLAFARVVAYPPAVP